MSILKKKYVYVPGMKITKAKFRKVGRTLSENYLKEKIELLVRIALTTENGYFDSASSRKLLLEVQGQAIRAAEIAYKKAGK